MVDAVTRKPSGKWSLGINSDGVVQYSFCTHGHSAQLFPKQGGLSTMVPEPFLRQDPPDKRLMQVQPRGRGQALLYHSESLQQGPEVQILGQLAHARHSQSWLARRLGEDHSMARPHWGSLSVYPCLSHTLSQETDKLLNNEPCL